MLFPNILIIGESGQGKSFSAQFLPPETTGILNVEMKDMPFNSSRLSQFKENIPCDSAETTRQALDYLVKHPGINIIFLDSLSMYFDLSEQENISIVNSKDTLGQWRTFGAKSKIFLRTLACANKLIIATGHQEWLTAPTEEPGQIGNVSQRRFKINGKQLEGKVESSFTIVLGAKARTVPGKPLEPIYEFVTRTDGVSSCKCPIDMQLPAIMPNDLGAVVAAIGKMKGIDFSKPFGEQGVK